MACFRTVRKENLATAYYLLDEIEKGAVSNALHKPWPVVTPEKRAAAADEVLLPTEYQVTSTEEGSQAWER